MGGGWDGFGEIISFIKALNCFPIVSKVFLNVTVQLGDFPINGVGIQSLDPFVKHAFIHTHMINFM